MTERPTLRVDPRAVLEREFIKLFGVPPARRPVPPQAPPPMVDTRGAGPNDTLVRMREYDTSLKWPDHAWVEIVDPRSGAVHVVRGGLKNLLVSAESEPWEASQESLVLGRKSPPQVRPVTSVVLRGRPAAEVRRQADAYVARALDPRSDYDTGHNSNSVAFGAYENLTGRKAASPDNWGQKNRLPAPRRPPLYSGPRPS